MAGNDFPDSASGTEGCQVSCPAVVFCKALNGCGSPWYKDSRSDVLQCSLWQGCGRTDAERWLEWQTEIRRASFTTGRSLAKLPVFLDLCGVISIFMTMLKGGVWFFFSQTVRNSEFMLMPFISMSAERFLCELLVCWLL